MPLYFQKCELIIVLFLSLQLILVCGANCLIKCTILSDLAINQTWCDSFLVIFCFYLFAKDAPNDWMCPQRVISQFLYPLFHVVRFILCDVFHINFVFYIQKVFGSLLCPSSNTQNIFLCRILLFWWCPQHSIKLFWCCMWLIPNLGHAKIIIWHRDTNHHLHEFSHHHHQTLCAYVINDEDDTSWWPVILNFYCTEKVCMSWNKCVWMDMFEKYT